MAGERILHSSATYHHTDLDLVPFLISAVVKCHSSPCAPVALADPTRPYMRMSAQGWEWAALTAEDSERLTFQVTADAAQSQSFLIVKTYCRSSEKMAWLAIAQPSQQLVVLKLFAPDGAGAEEAESERALWETVNGVHASCFHLKNAVALCTPMVIYASQDRDSMKVYFNLDIAERCCQRGAEPGALPAQLATFSAQVQELGTGLDVRDVAQRAIERTARAGVAHRDLEWRHVALLPLFDEAGAVIRLEPVLLDFGRVETGMEPGAALGQMQVRLEAMKAEATWASAAEM
jgi:hypothetical protein